MAIATAVPTDCELKVLDFSSTDTQDLVREAEANDAADCSLTLRAALKKYRRAVFWAMFLSTSLIMEGYDVVIITSFYGQTQFLERFGELDVRAGKKLISPAWQSGLTNSALIGQLAGLVVNECAQDRFGCRRTMMFFMGWMMCAIFIVFFVPSLSLLTFSEAMSGIPWGVSQTLSTYASEVVPTILRPYVTAYVCMCWGAGILLSSGVVRAMIDVQGNLAWRLPFAL
ncbi:uncharacterized protein M421DRAFT_404788 [Didymella exigua CBS 183.55]|uniref:Major facilitator superfamily (MFS) profile domain-containing protein n=1 Tax=Didymella exigua CBS 183.55 TaxID=1150837 RepID=A0A6A5R6P6_9PLEO|nr:uncharacterized protein M421DRAFT_404788 [Didymella exigua CBS 183.55]KAF1923841.1 hypothetical protein M421DRAFT_404788 [Didymella exigua CBS 183.55]